MGYVEEQYDMYKEDPASVDPSVKKMFDEHGAPDWLFRTDNVQPIAQENSINDVKKLTSAMKLVEAIRRYGHLEADIYPVGREERTSDLVDPGTYGLTEDDLRSIPASWLWDQSPANVENGYDVIQFLKKRYTGKISFEYDHVNNDDERKWLLERIESGNLQSNVTDEGKKQLLERLAHVEGFESFLQKTFVGQKRFSI